jgi:hypothetical protein
VNYDVALPTYEESRDVEIYNNIFPGLDRDWGWIIPANAKRFDHNCYYSQGLNLPKGNNPVISPVMPFANPAAFDGVLIPNCVAINAGSSIQATVTDITGMLRDAAPDIGAYEMRNQPIVAKQAVAQIKRIGDSAELSVQAGGPGPNSYQWYRNGVAVTGQTNSTISFTNLTRDQGGDYYAVITTPSGTIKTTSTRLSVGENMPGKLLQVSTLQTCSPSTPSAVIGFVVSGDTPTRILVRAIGPSLASYGIQNGVTDTTLELHGLIDGVDTLIAQNDDWSTEVGAGTYGDSSGAIPLNLTSKDSAVVRILQPGVYTAQIKSKNATSTGSVLLEVYEVP